MRYVTITRSKFFNNGMGVVPNALESEKFPPAEENVITDNDIFWNNFNFHAGAPFKPKKSGVVPLVPIGTGVLLLGGRGNRIEANRVFGNYLIGVAAIEGILLDKTLEARALARNEIKGNEFGARRQRPQRPRPRLRRQRHRQLLGPEHRRADHPARRPGDVPGLPVQRREHVQQRRAEPDRSASPARPPSTAGSSTRTRPGPA